MTAATASYSIVCKVESWLPHLNLYIRLVDTVALVRSLEMRLATSVQFWSVGMHPTPDATGISAGHV
jgi:hypothetical protein